MTQKVYLTTPIYYVNDVPHIGHSYCTLATDTLARYWRTKLGKENVYFLTGTDENSQKTLDAAEASEKPVQEYLDEMAADWRVTWETIGISFDDFIRTTEPRHIKVVQEVLQKIYDNGDIYKGEYKGLYCTGCEAFLKEIDLDENGHCPDHKKKPQELSEENYFFRLSNYESELLALFENNLLLPKSRKNEMVSFIKSGLEDISISRENAPIGIPFPFDEKHKIYVWVDALINYYSGRPDPGGESGADFWKNVTHIIGKDISKFHTIIWPAMLISAGITPPAHVFAHGFFTIDNTKMSKSLGNVISPLELAEKYGNDALRAGLLSSFEFGNDGDFSRKNFDAFYNAKLASGVGNLFNRVTVLLHKFMDGKAPEPERCKDAKDLTKTFEAFLETKKLKAAFDFYFGIVDKANQRMNETEVWKMAKTDPKQAEKIFTELYGYLWILTEMAEVLLPESFPKMKKMLGENGRIGAAEILFARR